MSGQQGWCRLINDTGDNGVQLDSGDGSPGASGSAASLDGSRRRCWRAVAGNWRRDDVVDAGRCRRIVGGESLPMGHRGRVVHLRSHLADGRHRQRTHHVHPPTARAPHSSVQQVRYHISSLPIAPVRSCLSSNRIGRHPRRKIRPKVRLLIVIYLSAPSISPSPTFITGIVGDGD